MSRVGTSQNKGCVLLRVSEEAIHNTCINDLPYHCLRIVTYQLNDYSMSQIAFLLQLARGYYTIKVYSQDSQFDLIVDFEV